MAERQVIYRMMHRCKDCGRHLSVEPGGRAGPCLCGGEFAPDARLHPDAPGAFYYTRPKDAPRCVRCGGQHLVTACALLPIEEVRRLADGAEIVNLVLDESDRGEAVTGAPTNGHNGHHYDPLLKIAIIGGKP